MEFPESRHSRRWKARSAWMRVGEVLERLAQGADGGLSPGR
jgi:hypothetical protein